ncbi:uncharacterized protein LOC112592355 [Melanaphis sacchari]|uniref:uncharacterized protein LOC112592355 n=1 Tax=Melanaphis sacchari TaxID=742174 RepID=UPI000DC13FD1|nr:uncharacterized protein LOC112592355 [Melanaphis sacchari]
MKLHERTITSSKPDTDIELNFVNFQEFEEWKSNEEVSTLSRFIKQRWSRFNKDKTVSTSIYYCHRSGKFTSKATGKRAMKIIDNFCPSYIRVVVKGCGNVEIKYCKTLKGHNNEVKYLPIPKKVQETISGK